MEEVEQRKTIRLVESNAVHSVLGNLSVTARRETDAKGNQNVNVFFWDPSTKPDWQGRIFPVRTVSLDMGHPEKRVRRGLFGLGKAATLHLFT